MKTQFVPVPASLTALGECDNPHVLYDVAGSGNAAMYAVSGVAQNVQAEFVTVSPDGYAAPDTLVTVPSVHCRQCGQRMFVCEIPLADDEHLPMPLEAERIIYKCVCGTLYSAVSGWQSTKEANE